MNQLTDEKVKTALFDVHKIREQFPVLRRNDNGKPLVYLDSGATSQIPAKVIWRVNDFLANENSNIHRGIYGLSQKASENYEFARVTVKNFINASSEREIVFTRNATESINLVANSFLLPNLNDGDEIIISQMEHHANIVSWQLLRTYKKIILKVLPITSDGELQLDELENLITERTKLIAVTHVSNVLGTINDVQEITRIAHSYEIPVLVDGAQAVPHMKIDVQKLDCDFYVFSGHKMYAPTGIGVLFAKEKHLKIMRPYQGGGDMILSVSFEKTIFNDIPMRFEAGTPNIVGTLALAEAINFLNSNEMEHADEYEKELIFYTFEKLAAIDRLKLVGTVFPRTGVFSFELGDAHPHDIAHELSIENIAVRAGNHCAQPLVKSLGYTALTRISISFYNTKEEIDKVCQILPEIERKFRL